MYFSKHVLCPNSYFFKRGTVLGAGIFWKLPLFLIVLINQSDSLCTWNNLPLTSIHSLQYTMICSDFEIPQPIIAENSKERINVNRGFVANVTCYELILVVISSNKIWIIVLINSVSLVDQNMLQWEFVKNS